jgi:hypothetical protein
MSESDPLTDDPDFVAPSFICPHCSESEHDPEDVREGYCATCRRFANEGHARDRG